jgi:hypothetical protein
MSNTPTRKRTPQKRSVSDILKDAKLPTADIDALYDEFSAVIRYSRTNAATATTVEPVIFTAFSVAYLSKRYDFRFADKLLQINPYMIHDKYRDLDLFDYFFINYGNSRNFLDILLHKIEEAEEEIKRRRIEKMEISRIGVRKNTPRNVTRKIRSYVNGRN